MRFAMRGVAAVATLGLLCAVIGAQDKGKDSLDDATFVKKAAMGNAKEIRMGTMAAKMATSTQVKEFAEKMVKDHTKAQEDLRKAARSASIDFPEEKGKAEKEKSKDDLRSGKDFDATFARMMVADHTKAAELYEQATKSVKNAELRKYAEQTLPVVREHLKMARKLNDEVGGKGIKEK